MAALPQLAHASPQPMLAIDPQVFQNFRALIHKHTGIWLRDGKQVMLASRLARRLRARGMSDFGDYFDYVQSVPSDSSEFREFINSITTNKTSFFREPHHFEFLSRTVSQMGASGPSRWPRSIRVWSAACSTGEEPYTIAITLLEAMAKWKGTSSLSSQRVAACLPASIEIAASDIDTAVLSKAFQGIYPEESLSFADPSLRSKYFLRGTGPMQGQLKVKGQLANLVEFKQINFMSPQWAVEGPFDAIFCRNVLIYFQQDVQDKILRRMARLLKPGGHLFLGNSEHIPWLNDIYRPLRQTVYQRREAQNDRS